MKTRIQEIHEQTEQEVYSHLQIQHNGVVLHSQIQTKQLHFARTPNLGPKTTPNCLIKVIVSLTIN